MTTSMPGTGARGFAENVALRRKVVFFTAPAIGGLVEVSIADARKGRRTKIFIGRASTMASHRCDGILAGSSDIEVSHRLTVYCHRRKRVKGRLAGVTVISGE